MMCRTLVLGLAALALIGGPSALRAQQPGTPDKSTGGPSEPGAQLMQHRALLLKQCTALAELPDTEAAKLPINVVKWGTAGRPVFIVHGGTQGVGDGPDDFVKQKVLAEQGWRLLLPERPGFGQSPSRGPDNQEAEPVWIAGMLEDGVHLIGHSWGGNDALLAAARRPTTVRSLILVEPALAQLLQIDSKFRDDPRGKQGQISVPAAMLAANSPGQVAIGFTRSLGPPTAGSHAANAIEAAMEAKPDLAARAGCALLQAKRAPDATLLQAAETLKKANVPVLVITGGWSPSMDLIGSLVADLTGGHHVIVQSPNHYIMSANVDGFNNTIANFMRKADSDRGSAAVPPR